MSEEDSNSERDPRIAAGISAVGLLFPIAAGGGHLYNGDVLRGITISVIQLINAFTILFLIGLFTYPLLGLYFVYDAYKGDDAPLYGITNNN